MVNIWTVNKGKAAATADRTMVLAANAEELYILNIEVLQLKAISDSEFSGKDIQIGIDDVCQERYEYQGDTHPDGDAA